MAKFSTLCLTLLVGCWSATASPPELSRATQSTPRPQSQTTSSGRVFNPFSVRTHRAGNQVGINLRSIDRFTAASTSGRHYLPPAAVGASGSTIYSAVSYSRGAALTGACEVFTDATVSHLADIRMQSYGNAQEFGTLFVRDGKLHVYTTEWDEYWGIVDFMGNYYYEVDLATNEVTVTKLSDIASVFNVSAYNPDEDRIYGYLATETAAWYGWAPGSDPLDFHQLSIIANNDFPEGIFGLSALTYNQISGKYVGVYNASCGGGVYEMDPATGQLTRIATLQYPTRYTTGLCYSPLDGGYVFMQSADGSNSIQILDEKSFKTLSKTDYGYDIQFAPFYCTDRITYPDAAPVQADLISLSFPDGALDGTLTFRMGTETYAGNPILGNIDWALHIDGTEYKRGNAPAGSELKISVEGLREGEHTFTLYSSLGGVSGRETSESAYIGNDTPLAPSGVTLTENLVTWQPPTGGTHNGYIDTDAVSYNVYINESPVAVGIKSTQCYPRLANDKPLDFYTASVEAVYDGKVSEKAFSDDIVYGQPLTPPYNYLPTAKESRLITVIDGNGDNKKLDYYADYKDAAAGEFSGYIYKYSRTEAADEWLFLPPTQFTDPDAVYVFTTAVFGTNARYQERYEVLLCKSPDNSEGSVVRTITAERDASTFVRGASTLENIRENHYFTVPEAGCYYVAIHVTSPKDLYNLYITGFDLRVADGVAAGGPLAPSDLTAAAAPEGGLKASVSFTMPSRSVSGKEFDAGTTLTAFVQAADCEGTSVSGHPGESVSTEVATLQGDNLISVAVSDGDAKGAKASASVYTGVVIPGAPRDLKASVSDDDMTMTLTWAAPESGSLENGYVAPTGIKYYLCVQETIDGMTGWSIAGLVGEDVYTCEYKLEAGSDLQAAHVGIVAENAAGLAEELAVVHEIMGTPLEIPFENNFSAGDYVSPILSFDSSAQFFVDDPGVMFSKYSTPDKRKALFTQSFYSIPAGRIVLPKFSTEGMEHAAFEISAFGGSCKAFAVYAKASGMQEAQLIRQFAKEDFAEPGPMKERMELPSEFQNKPWVEITLQYNTTGYTESFIVYGFRYIDNIPHDFGVIRIGGTKTAHIGEEARFTAQAVNNGYEPGVFPGGEWTLTDESGNVVARARMAAGTETIATDDVVIQEISYTPTADDEGSMTLSFVLDPDGGNDSNNSASYVFNVEKGTTPVVTDLHAEEISFDRIALAWTAPEAAPFTESFEDETPFILDDASETIASFRRHDGDGKSVWGIDNDGYAALEWASEPMSFMVWSQAEMGAILGNTAMVDAKTGDKLIVALCPATESADEEAVAADDWLVSPAIDGGSRLSFSIRAFSYAFGEEKVEILVSSTGDEISDFKPLATLSLEGSADERPMWQEYVYDLPSDARYFAIHYVSRDRFGIMIDDIAYTPEGKTLKVDSYEIYRNGTRLNGSAHEAYADTDVAAETEYSYIVVPVLSDGSKGLKGNTLTVRTTGVENLTGADSAIYSRDGFVIVRGFEGKRVAVISSDGRTIATVPSASAEERIAAASGIYLVHAADKVCKLIVK